jgi:hypothetical protein
VFLYFKQVIFSLRLAELAATKSKPRHASGGSPEGDRAGKEFRR